MATAALACLASATGVLGIVGPANATTNYTVYNHCSAGWFTGTVRVKYNSKRLVSQVAYKIDKGHNKGGNSANVDWIDYGVMPRIDSATTRGIQDGRYHVLREANYYRGSGDSVGFFIFDKSGAADPRCTTSDTL